MRIKKVRLSNFRCFEDYALTFSDRFTLLIGDNGSGKTAVLDLLALAMSDFIRGFPRDIKPTDLRSISDDDVRYTLLLMGQTLVRQTNAVPKIEIEGVFDNKAVCWEVIESSSWFIYEHPCTNIASQLAENITKPETLLPILAYYGTGRLWKKPDSQEIETLSPDSRLLGYRDCLSPASNLDRLFRWFKTQELAALQKQEPRYVFEAVKKAMVSMISDADAEDAEYEGKIWWDVDWDELLIETVVQGKRETMRFRLLSDGYRNMLGMVADIAYRMATLNPQLQADVIKQTEGIVLIDEIDLHLHPKWQRQVVGRLLDTFPKVQFVASSHSPFIIQSLYHREDVLLWDLETNQAVVVDSKSIEDIAENQQGVEIPQQSQRFLDMEKAAEAYYTALQKIPSVSEEEKQYLRQRLDDLLLPYSDDPAFQAFLKMERQAADGNARQ
ncbi:AAA family ATPase [Methylovulum psychrotolerans]|uniref:AAA family ATPase n=1 Tax=Methylovulum psychrotolerans TaxID=1704499 RepID=UPI001BFF38ED|nr:AAA family ATPase [Methylovulum psychrotolerans]MBT9098120.1 AAA family ATPase [Methylovulum psychrotolerans]